METKFTVTHNVLLGDQPHFGEFCNAQNLKLRYNTGYNSGK